MIPVKTQFLSPRNIIKLAFFFLWRKIKSRSMDKRDLFRAGSYISPSASTSSHIHLAADAMFGALRVS